MARSFNKIDLPVSVIKPFFHHGRTLFDADTVLNPSAPILATEPVPALLSALTQVFVECAAPAMVGIHMLIDAFMAHRRFTVFAHHSSNLFGTEVIPQVRLDLGLDHWGELGDPAARKTPIFGLPLCLFVPVAALPAVTPELAADRAFVASQTGRDLSLSISLFTHPFYRVSFLSS